MKVLDGSWGTEWRPGPKAGLLALRPDGPVNEVEVKAVCNPETGAQGPLWDEYRQVPSI